MKFSDWIKIKEQAVSAAPSAAPATSATAVPSLPSSGGTKTSDIATVPQKMFGGIRQTSDKCGNCSKDYKNWYIPKKRRKK